MKPINLFDDVCRILASPISRRRAVKYLSVLLGTTTVGALGAKSTRTNQLVMCGSVESCIDDLDEFRPSGCDSAKICQGQPVGTVVSNNGRSCVCVAECWNFPDFDVACCTCLRED
jgi:hypothetical protein